MRSARRSVTTTSVAAAPKAGMRRRSTRRILAGALDGGGARDVPASRHRPAARDGGRADAGRRAGFGASVRRRRQRDGGLSRVVMGNATPDREARANRASRWRTRRASTGDSRPIGYTRLAPKRSEHLQRCVRELSRRIACLVRHGIAVVAGSRRVRSRSEQPDPHHPRRHHPPESERSRWMPAFAGALTTSR